MSSVFVTGANRGIGLGLVQQFLKKSNVGKVFATARNVDTAEDLKAIKDPRLHLISLELVDEASIKKAVEEVEKIVGENGLDFLVNNAGILHKVDIANLEKKVVMEQLEVNSVAPLLLTSKAADKKGSAQVANISSTGGSLEIIGKVPMQKLCIYSMSKAAMNMMTRHMAMEWKADKIRATAFCPGWVQTDMGGKDAMLSFQQPTLRSGNALSKKQTKKAEGHRQSFKLAFGVAFETISGIPRVHPY